ncbi:MAG: CheR family methyltransferase, partial [Burkholderiales bacterium]
MTTIQDVPVFERILQHLHQTRGFDFTAYTRSSLLRRVSKRMQAVHAPTFEAYLEYLQDHQEEGAALFDTVVVHVTSFFRDPEVWQHFSERIAPDLIASAGDGGIRVWCAGCASGEEPYTVAMLLAERLGVDGVRRRVKIYATDVDAAALTAARRAV